MWSRTAVLKKYRVTPSEYERMVSDQNGCCAICGNPPEKKKYLVVDHDHNDDLGSVRGLLCDNCNLLLGHAKDNIQTLQAAIEYLLAGGHPSRFFIKSYHEERI